MYKARTSNQYGTRMPVVTKGTQKWVALVNLSVIFGMQVRHWMTTNNIKTERMSFQYTEKSKVHKRTCLCVRIEDADRFLIEYKKRPNSLMRQAREWLAKFRREGNTSGGRVYLTPPADSVELTGLKNRAGILEIALKYCAGLAELMQKGIVSSENRVDISKEPLLEEELLDSTFREILNPSKFQKEYDSIIERIHALEKKEVIEVVGVPASSSKRSASHTRITEHSTKLVTAGQYPTIKKANMHIYGWAYDTLKAFNGYDAKEAARGRVASKIEMVEQDGHMDAFMVAVDSAILNNPVKKVPEDRAEQELLFDYD